ncbi:Protein tyrosine and serine/threonine kinase [Pelomyxa schiedti]|nr:Protein tyrosine and serine/threonine kinase [Pelomyxa schiedti]
MSGDRGQRNGGVVIASYRAEPFGNAVENFYGLTEDRFSDDIFLQKNALAMAYSLYRTRSENVPFGADSRATQTLISMCLVPSVRRALVGVSAPDVLYLLSTMSPRLPKYEAAVFTFLKEILANPSSGPNCILHALELLPVLKHIEDSAVNELATYVTRVMCKFSRRRDILLFSWKAIIALSELNPQLVCQCVGQEGGLEEMSDLWRSCAKKKRPLNDQPGSWISKKGMNIDQQTMQTTLQLALKAACPRSEILNTLLNCRLTLDLSHSLRPNELSTLVHSLKPFKKLILSRNAIEVLPPEFFRLTRLQHLNLYGNKLKVLPSEISLLENLEYLRLCNNSLTSLPTALCRLPKLKSIFFGFNPLVGYPSGFALSGTQNVINYLRQSEQATEPWDIIRLLVVGEEGVGKTTLIKLLHDKHFSLGENLSTNGIKLSSLTLRAENKKYHFGVWDFGGQEVFYPTHQFFLSGKSTTYILVCDLSQGLESRNRLSYWLHQIEAVSRPPHMPPVIVVGTHADRFPSFEEAAQSMSDTIGPLVSTFSNVKAMVPVNPVNQEGMTALKATVINVSKQLITKQPVLYKRVAKVIQKKLSERWVPLATFRTWVDSTGISYSTETFLALTKFLNDAGIITAFQNWVVTDPQLVIDIMAQVISFSSTFGKKDGIITESQQSLIWKGFEGIPTHSLAELLVNFSVAHFLPDNTSLIVPFMLPDQEPDRVQLLFEGALETSGWSHKGRIFHFAFMPLGFFGRLLVHIFHQSDLQVLDYWLNGAVVAHKSNTEETIPFPPLPRNQWAKLQYDPKSFSLDIHFFLPTSTEVVISQTQSLIRSVNELVENLTESFYRKLTHTMKRLIPCTHCLTGGERFATATMFSYENAVSVFISNERLECVRGASSVSIDVKDIAPDIVFSDMTVLDGISIIKKIGQGGFGAVYQGTWSDNLVAIKELIQPNNSTEATAVEQFVEFQKEAFMMSCLYHPNLIRLFGVTVKPAYMVMEFATGGDLAHFLHPEEDVDMAQDDCPPPLRMHILLTAARGMEFLHSLSPPVIHRDLRSANIFLDGAPSSLFWTGKIADFGMSRRLGPKIAGALANWEWLAPEVWASSDGYDHRSDVYSFGLILWESAALSVPYMEFFKSPKYLRETRDSIGNTKIIPRVHELKQDILKGLRPSDLRTLPAKNYVSLSFIELAEACLQHDPSLRPSFPEIVKVLQEEFNTAVANLAAATAPVTPTPTPSITPPLGKSPSPPLTPNLEASTTPPIKSPSPNNLSPPPQPTEQSVEAGLL